MENEQISQKISDLRIMYENNVQKALNGLKYNETEDSYGFFEDEEGDLFLENISSLESAVESGNKADILNTIKKTKNLINSNNYKKNLSCDVTDTLSNYLVEIREDLKRQF